MAKRRRRALHELPLRFCRWGERCLVCLEPIDTGEQYHDGGYGRRVHMSCAALVEEGKRREPTPAEVRELEQAESDVSRAKGRVYVARDDMQAGRLAVAQLKVAKARLERLKENWAEVGGE
jgi:hypothetical protein